MVIIVLVLLGLCFGSFVNALVWRIHKQSKIPKRKSADYSIINGRSMCPNCKHELNLADLIPIFSWLFLRGKCRYCQKPISPQYPLVELLTAVLFVFSYIFWPNELTGLELVNFSLWLVLLTGFMALAIYDIRWMLLPNKIIFPLYGVAALYVAIDLIQTPTLESLLNILASIAIAGGLFYILFQVSKGKWIGGGDVKLGFLLGAVLVSPSKAMLMLFIASLMGTLYSLFLLFIKKTDKAKKIPFGPFLLGATILVVVMGDRLIDWYFDLILL